MAIAALIMVIAVAVLPEIARSTLTLSPMSTLYLPYGLDSSGQELYSMEHPGAVRKFTYDAKTYHVYTVGSAQGSYLNVVDVSDPKNLTVEFRLQLPGVATNIDSCGNYVAVSSRSAESATAPGSVFIYGKYVYHGRVKKNMTLHQHIQVGPWPGMVKFTKDCMTLVTCNQGRTGQGESGNFVDPEGSVSVITFPSEYIEEEVPTVRTATFEQFNAQAEEYSSRGLRWIFPRLEVGEEFLEFTLSQTLEPEHVDFSLDESKAYISLQEGNAFAVMDIKTATFDDIYPLGSKYWGTAALDTSDADGGIVMRDWPIYGLYQPDGIRVFRHKGRNYILSADEGQTTSRQAPNGTRRSDRLRGRQLLENSLLSSNFKSQRVRKALNLTSELGCLVFSSLDGMDPMHPGKYSSLHAFGGRGFSVWNADDLTVAWESGDDVERMLALNYPAIFNTIYRTSYVNDTPAHSFDEESCRLGPQIESAEVGQVDGQTVFFVGDERTSVILIYKLADDDIMKPVFQSIYFPGQQDMTYREAYDNCLVGDVQPEDLKFVSASDSPTNTPLLVVSGTFSGSVTVYEVVEFIEEISASPMITASWFVSLSVVTILFTFA